MTRRPAPGFSCELSGTIASAGFSSGHRFVVGHWVESPIGPLDDVMWARPDGTRLLLVDRLEAAQLITSVYRFDTVEVLPLRCRMDGAVLVVTAGEGPRQKSPGPLRPFDLQGSSQNRAGDSATGPELRVSMRGGRRWPIPLSRLRGRAPFRPLEGLLARGLLGVRTSGVSPTGVQEWYRADEYRRVVAAQARLDGRDLGGVRGFHEPARFGFSEPPRCPSMVWVRPRLHDPSGRLAEVVAPPGRSDDLPAEPVSGATVPTDG